MTGAGGFSSKRRKTIRRVAEGARSREMDRISSRLRDAVTQALEAHSAKFALWCPPTPLALLDVERIEDNHGVLGPSDRRLAPLVSKDDAERESIVVDTENFDATTSFDTEVTKLVRATADLAEERRATVVALAEMSARADRIDRVQNENRAGLAHLLAH